MDFVTNWHLFQISLCSVGATEVIFYFRVPYSQRYLFYAIPDTKHNANPTNPNRISKGNPNPTIPINPNTKYRCEYVTLTSNITGNRYTVGAISLIRPALLRALGSAYLRQGKFGPDPNSGSGRIPKFIWDFLVWSYIHNNMFMKIRSFFSRDMSQIVEKCPISQCWKSFKKS